MRSLRLAVVAFLFAIVPAFAVVARPALLSKQVPEELVAPELSPTNQVGRLTHLARPAELWVVAVIVDLVGQLVEHLLQPLLG